MRFLILIFCNLFIFSFNYARQKNAILVPDTLKIRPLKIIENDTVDFGIVIPDPGFRNFLIKQPAKEFYSLNFYKTWNNWYVMEWNSRQRSNSKPQLYNTVIEYDPNQDYGLDVEYRLYNFFLYFENKNHMRLLPKGR